jgi:hypothetical protein
MKSSWHVFDPEALYWGLRHVPSLWGAKSIFITENGCGASDVISEDGKGTISKRRSGSRIENVLIGTPGVSGASWHAGREGLSSENGLTGPRHGGLPPTNRSRPILLTGPV